MIQFTLEHECDIAERLNEGVQVVEERLWRVIVKKALLKEVLRLGAALMRRRKRAVFFEWFHARFLIPNEM